MQETMSELSALTKSFDLAGRTTWIAASDSVQPVNEDATNRAGQRLTNFMDVDLAIQRATRAVTSRYKWLVKDRALCLDLLGLTTWTNHAALQSVAAIVESKLTELVDVRRDRNYMCVQNSEYECEIERLTRQTGRMAEEMIVIENFLKSGQDELLVFKKQLTEIGKSIMLQTAKEQCRGKLTREKQTNQTSPYKYESKNKKSRNIQSCHLTATRNGEAENKTKRHKQVEFVQVSEENIKKLRKHAEQMEKSLNSAMTTTSSVLKASTHTKKASDSSSSSRETVLHDIALSTKNGLPNKKSTAESSMDAKSVKTENDSYKAKNNPNEVIKKDRTHPNTNKRCLSNRDYASKSVMTDPRRNRTLSVGSKKEPRGNNKLTVGKSRLTKLGKCLRCQKLFTATDNHKLSCCFHRKSKERIEVYNEIGLLTDVRYVWKCCQHEERYEGCCYDHHV